MWYLDVVCVYVVPTKKCLLSTTQKKANCI
jgi:hypothetical protein